MPIHRLAAWLILLSAVALAQDARYTDAQSGTSFQPPAGWSPEHTIRYVGPQRDDQTRPVLTLRSEEGALSLADKNADALVAQLQEELASQGLTAVQVVDRRKRMVSGADALQVDLTYSIGEGAMPLRQREVYVPVAEQKRTYRFTFVDAASHFDESAAAAESAISSFTARVPAPDAGKDAGRTADTNRLLLIVVGAVALAAVVIAGYLLVRGRA